MSMIPCFPVLAFVITSNPKIETPKVSLSDSIIAFIVSAGTSGVS